jgi:hypothetical protein
LRWIVAYSHAIAAVLLVLSGYAWGKQGILDGSWKPPVVKKVN